MWYSFSEYHIKIHMCVQNNYTYQTGYTKMLFIFNAGHYYFVTDHLCLHAIRADDHPDHGHADHPCSDNSDSAVQDGHGG